DVRVGQVAAHEGARPLLRVEIAFGDELLVGRGDRGARHPERRGELARRRPAVAAREAPLPDAGPPLVVNQTLDWSRETAVPGRPPDGPPAGLGSRCRSDRDDRRRPRAGALGIPSLDELPLGGRPRSGAAGRRPRREACRAPRLYEPRRAGPLAGTAANHRAGA